MNLGILLFSANQIGEAELERKVAGFHVTPLVLMHIDECDTPKTKEKWGELIELGVTKLNLSIKDEMNNSVIS